MAREETIMNGIRVITVTTDENTLATDELKTQRLDICNSCEEFNDNSCNICGCIVHTLMTNIDSQCPLNKW